MSLPATATKPLIRRMSWAAAAALRRAISGSGALTSSKPTVKLVKSSWSWSPAPSWCEGRASRSLSAAASRPKRTLASIAPCAARISLTSRRNRPPSSAQTRASVRSSSRSVLLSTTRSAQANWSSNSSSSGLSWSRVWSARRSASTAAGSDAKRPAATASPSITAITPSTVTRVRISGQLKALIKGLGSARPEVSMTMWSGGSGRASRASMVGTKSSATVQQMQPLASSTTSPSAQPSMPQDFKTSASTPRSPNSLMMSARRRPFAVFSRCRIMLVLPAPRKPVITVAGSLPLDFLVPVMIRAISKREAQPRVS